MLKSNCRLEPLQAEFEFATSFADTARQMAMSYFRKSNGLAWKSDETPVTLADTEIEDAFRKLVQTEFPADGIFGEETGVSGRGRPRIWVVDPIDGTGAFATGSPLFGVLLCLVVKEQAAFGVIDACATGERWIGQRGKGASLNGVTCATSGRTSLREASLASTSIHLLGARERRVFDKLSTEAAMIRLGGDCYAYGLLASGHLDQIIEAGLKPFDFMALTVIIEEAGGVISDWQGRPLTLNSSGDVLASATADLHAQALKVIKETK
ncbi:inositol monophosphatase family protein [Tateyamaria pelophila]|uniref:inositol monophosphatase family protein n=1 Tax=Tateyamaria pelophila TaxID=328415 RepID=UPI001CBDACAC|nr:inositol monophosphatase family protein [Tateyamaria pelophila]